MARACARARVRPHHLVPNPSPAPKVGDRTLRLAPGRPGQSYLFTGEPLVCLNGTQLQWRAGGKVCKQCKRSAGDGAAAGGTCQHCADGTLTKAGAAGGYTQAVKHEGEGEGS
jgi:hypothetical protein